MRIRQQAADWRVIYETFLRSPEWARKRALVLTRCGGVCESCLTQRAHVVHHTTYPAPATMDTLTAQPNWFLRGLCHQCHDLFTGTAYTGPKAVAKVARRWGK